MRSENHNFCFGLFRSYISLKKTKRKGAIQENPFYGSVLFDDSYFIYEVKKNIKNLLFTDQIGNENIKCFGFK